MLSLAGRADALALPGRRAAEAVIAARDGNGDDALMARVASGDTAAFARLMERHVDGAFRVALRILGRRAAAEDAVQDAFLRLWSKAGSWRPGGAKVSTWLWRVTVNLCLDERRRGSPVPLEAAPEPADPAPAADTALAAAEQDRALAAAVVTLPERQRAAIGLVYGSGASNGEAAAALGISVGALEQLLVRAKRALRERLKDEEHGP
jgi:RNA polymerase sigma-70 factor (ECF subfamily)